MKYFSLIWSNLLRKKLRTTLTLLSIFIAFLLYGYLAAIRGAFAGNISMQGAERLITRHKVSIAQLLPIRYRSRIAQIPGVKNTVTCTWFGGIYQHPYNFFPQIVVNQESYFDVYSEFKVSEKERQAWLNTRDGVIVGRSTARRFGWKIGDRIPIQATIWIKPGGSQAWEFEIVGIYDGQDKETDSSQMFIRYDYFDETRLFAKGQIGWFVVKVADPQNSFSIIRQIDTEFANSSAGETKSETEKAFAQAFAKQIGDIGKILIAILSAVFFTILLVAGNTMAQAVRERREELGVLKAIGFTNAGVLGLVLGESIVLSGVGGFAGLGLAIIIIAQGDPTHGALPVFVFPASDVLLGVGITIGLGLLAGIFPALQAMRLNVAEALRRM